jgi:hypothetical protein
MEIFTKDMSYLWFTMKTKCWKTSKQDCPEAIGEKEAGYLIMMMMTDDKHKITKDTSQRVNIITENSADDDIDKTNSTELSPS